MGIRHSGGLVSISQVSFDFSVQDSTGDTRNLANVEAAVVGRDGHGRPDWKVYITMLGDFAKTEGITPHHLSICQDAMRQLVCLIQGGHFVEHLDSLGRRLKDFEFEETED